MKSLDWPAIGRRVARTFGQAFAATYGLTNLIDAAGGSTEWDVGLGRAAAVSGLVAVASFIWNTILDPSPIPSLTAPEANGPNA